MNSEYTKWIMIPDQDDSKEQWVGQISRDVIARAPWRLELIRLADPADLYRIDPFDKVQNVVGLLDYERPCTLIRPLIENINPGSLSYKNKYQRTIISGQFHALLSDIPAIDGNEKNFLGLAFQSDSLDAWFSKPTFNQDFDPENQKQTLDIKPSEKYEYTIQNVGSVTITRAANISSTVRSSSLRSNTIFKVEFNEPFSINRVMDIALGFERLFGFLIGFRGPYPIYKTWINSVIKIDDFEFKYDGTLEIANLDWIDGEIPHPFKCIHHNGKNNIEIDTILNRFIAQENDIINRIHAVEFSRFFSVNLNDRFAVLLPILESYVQSRYKSVEEESYIQAQSDFFDWIDKSPSEDVRNFSLKHVLIKEKKAPSLKTLLARAIEFLNDKGFCFDAKLAERIQQRRGKLFHAAPQIEEDDVENFSVEVRAATGILLLHTLDDLGIDISYLPSHIHALNDMRSFMPKLKPDNKNNNVDKLKK